MDDDDKKGCMNRDQEGYRPEFRYSRVMGKMSGSVVINVKRPVYQLDDLHDGNPNVELETTVKRKKVAKLNWSDVKTVVPAIDWLFTNYNWSEDFFKDFVAGFTVAVLNIPQGMAYAMLGNVDPTVGLYMAIMPVIVYSLLGTSKHVSMGSFSVVCLMTGKVVSTYANANANNANYINANVDADPTAGTFADPAVSLQPHNAAAVYTSIEVATAVTLMVGLIQILMYVFRLGVVCTILSETLVSGFTAGAAVHVVTSQMKELLGVKIENHNGLFQIVLTYYDIANRIRDVNFATITVSIITVVLLLSYNMHLKAFINKRLFMPVPIELITIVIGTALFQFTTFSEDYQIKLIGEIERGLPDFKPPPVNLLMSVITESVIIAIVAYSITMSMALLFSEKLKYTIDTNQELLAQGVGNVFGSFFSCLPFAASLSRSATQQTVGGRTQMASIVSAGLLVAVVLWIGHLFQPLPRCVLASITIVALKDILLQVRDVVRVWRTSKADAAIWIATYCTVVLVEIDVGLLAGVVVSLFFVFSRGIGTGIVVLGRIPDTDLYVDMDRYRRAVEVPRVRIIHYSGSLNVTNRNAFRDKVHGALSRYDGQLAPITISINSGKETVVRAQCVVFDLSGMHYVDSSGLTMFARLVDQLNEAGLLVYVAAVSGNVYDNMRAKQLGTVQFFPTVHDAVEFYNNLEELRA
ncbi:prestin isoform X2 [Rhopalosiphum padi]|uniref:prestin isoform X2 n=1 Tax=Rhopalosiphum padi TaxID=40932 RepID=UPI00298D7143|nr:prestin isoform X2 [Rhopalosiphum padi]XP_060852780.1 prestin isoform X2 [Rhopalosiphum padi]XP_060852781.1 prestin isoform X2 [Rhopalosiphum padi]XP_060852782.1 prestin isoform X2 [Rhopalosiphum padi]